MPRCKGNIRERCEDDRFRRITMITVGLCVEAVPDVNVGIWQQLQGG